MNRKVLLGVAFFVILSCTKEKMGQKPIAQPIKASYLALGDSYTIGQGVLDTERWPNQLVDSLTQRQISLDTPRIIARTGWRTDQLQAAIDTIKKKDWDFVSLLIGVNDYYQNWPVQAFVPKFERILDSAIALAGKQKEHVLVVSIPDYGYTPFGQGNLATISAGLNNYNLVIKGICETKNVTFINITDISQLGLIQPNLVAQDGLHPSGKQYGLWVKRMVSNPFFDQFR